MVEWMVEQAQRQRVLLKGPMLLRAIKKEIVESRSRPRPESIGLEYSSEGLVRTDFEYIRHYLKIVRKKRYTLWKKGTDTCDFKDIA